MSGKIAEVNLEQGQPNADDALKKMINALTTAKREGFKSLIMIHGHGSTGVGGSIKMAVHNRLKDKDGSLRGIVRDYTCGDQWFQKKTEMLDVCNDLKRREREIDGNPGITVVLLRK